MGAKTRIKELGEEERKDHLKLLRGGVLGSKNSINAQGGLEGKG